jgi:hypothetical protein
LTTRIIIKKVLVGGVQKLHPTSEIKRRFAQQERASLSTAAHSISSLGSQQSARAFQALSSVPKYGADPMSAIGL